MLSFIGIVLSIILSIFSTGIMSYLALAIPIGPWIAPTVVLMAMVCMHVLRIIYTNQLLGYVTIAASVGGIIATAFSFSFPTLYFLDATLFASWLANPLYFCSVLAGLALSAGSLGYVLANAFEHHLIDQEKLSFPIANMIQRMIVAQRQITKAYELMVGFFVTSIFCLLQDGWKNCVGMIPKSITLFPAYSFGIFTTPALVFDIWPLLWSIGFVTGHVIAIPLAIGAVLKYMFVDVVHAHYFTNLSSVEFSLAFCSGLVLYGTIHSFMSLPKSLMTFFRKIRFDNSSSLQNIIAYNNGMHVCIVLTLVVLFLSLFSFPWYVQIYLLGATIFWTYQIAIIGGKVGLAPLGRFATFVMVPAMVLFNLNYVQIVLVATFVEICAGVTVDMLFGRKLMRDLPLNREAAHRYQLLGLIVSSLVIGSIFWILITKFNLGSTQLFAVKAQSRKLLINAHQFNYIVLVIGAAVGLVLDYMKINGALVLTGILMPVNYSFGLIVGSLLTLLVKQKEEWYPVWSGVFAANSLWMILQAML